MGLTDRLIERCTMFFEVIRYRGRRRVGVDAYTRSGVFHNQASPRAGNDRAGIAPTPLALADEMYCEHGWLDLGFASRPCGCRGLDSKERGMS